MNRRFSILLAAVLLSLSIEWFVAPSDALGQDPPGGEAGETVEPSRPAAAILQEVQNLEEQGEFEEAWRILSDEVLNDEDLEEHKVELKKFLAFRSAEDVLTPYELYDELLETAKTLKSEFDPVRDLYLLAALQKQIIELEKRLTSVKKERAEDAPTGLAKIWAGVSSSLMTATETITGWVLYFLLAVAAVYLLKGLRGGYIRWLADSRLGKIGPLKLVRSATLVRLEDLTPKDGEPEVKNSALTLAFLQELRALSQPIGASVLTDESWSLGDIEVEAARLHPTTFVSVGSYESFMAALQEKTGKDGDEYQVAIGPIKLSAKYFLGVFSRYFSRPFQHELVGRLVAKGDARVELSLERRRGAGKREIENQWIASGAGESAARDAVREAAARLFVDTADSYFTKEWLSLRLFNDAREDLSAGAGDNSARPRDSVGDVGDDNRYNPLKSGRLALERSVTRDPTNWPARFSLGILLRKLGATEAAADQFAETQRLLTQLQSAQEPFLTDYMKQRPEFPLLVRYNHAISCSRTDPQSCREALESLEGLLDELAKDESILPPDKDNLETLIRSSCASILVFLLEQNRRPLERTGDWHTLWRKTPERIEKERDWLRDRRFANQRLAGTQLRALAGAETALGRARYLQVVELSDTILADLELSDQELYGLSIDSLRRAIALSPDLRDPYVSLGAVYYRRCDKPGINRPHVLRLATESLERAIERDPGNKKAHYLLGRVYREAEYLDLDQAKAHLEKSGPDPASYYMLSLVLEEIGQLPEAIKELKQSLAMDPMQLNRCEQFIRWSIQLAGEGDRQWLTDAGQHVQTLIKSESEDYQQIGGELLDEIDKLQKSDLPHDPNPVEQPAEGGDQ